MEKIKTIGEGRFNLRNLYWQYRIRKDPSSFIGIKGPNVSMVSYMLDHNPQFISKNNQISGEVMQKVLSEDKLALKYFGEPPYGIVDDIARKTPYFLKDAKLSEDVQTKLYQKDSGFFKYITEPCAAVQSMAVRDDWKSMFKISNPSDSAYSSFLNNALGIDAELNSDIKNSINTLLGRWKDIQTEYQTQPSVMVDTLQMYKKLDESGINLNEDVKNEIYFQRYKFSIVEFQKSTGLVIQSKGSISALESDGGVLRLQALKEGIKEGTQGKIPSSEEIYTSSAEKIINAKKTLESTQSMDASTLSSLIGNTEAENLTQVLKENGIPLSSLSGKDILNLKGNKNVALSSSKALQRVKTPVGYVYRAFQMMQEASSMGQCEM